MKNKTNEAIDFRENTKNEDDSLLSKNRKDIKDLIDLIKEEFNCTIRN